MTEKSPERLVFFTDAVVAIALTLLVLPLTEIVPEVVAAHGEPLEAVTGHQQQIWSFLLSFVVISRQWIAHHRLFEHIRAYNQMLFMVNLLWLLTVVVLPFATQMVGAFGTDKFTCLLYIGTMVVNSTCHAVMSWTVRAHPELAVEGDGITVRWLFNAIGSAIAMAVAFLLAAVFHDINYFGILLLLVPPVVARLVYPSVPKPARLSE
ncbi:TMEM175 family protein [Kutzneria sp. CA-103260]|uniref:TMEM175 family protein n=1 Tax=Kutzneria sp. CA-103260 TaxID=2802641 RepID=UPI001BA53252|nr:TMEM175 family protein [Kutzneria sp. CA-103260]QUQ68566.1 hypothetical protein JJ691_63120 [Kutzneria sp. CA-103260]